MSRLDDAKFAWKCWNRLSEIEQLLWNYYENEFLDFIMEEDRNYLGPLYEQKDPPLESSQ
jgi:succinate dehydrogenase flavin-adding protein (antitoxin of CptAB toxin-antitoxin module)